jgi:hypothetical protein
MVICCGERLGARPRRGLSFGGVRNRLLHVILDNLPVRKSQPVCDWLALKKRRRWAPALYPDELVMAQPRRVLVLRAQPQSLDQH